MWMVPTAILWPAWLTYFKFRLDPSHSRWEELLNVLVLGLPHPGGVMLHAPTTKPTHDTQGSFQIWHSQNFRIFWPPSNLDLIFTQPPFLHLLFQDLLSTLWCRHHIWKLPKASSRTSINSFHSLLWICWLHKRVEMMKLKLYIRPMPKKRWVNEKVISRKNLLSKGTFQRTDSLNIYSTLRTK